MRKGRLYEEQMVGFLRDANRKPVALVAKKHVISEQTIYTWRQLHRHERRWSEATAATEARKFAFEEASDRARP